LSNFNSQAILTLFAGLKTQAASSGLFDGKVLGHEPRSAPGMGFTYALWLGPVTPVPLASGLNSTTGRVIVSARIYTPFLQKSEDQIETDLMRRVLQMIGFYSGELTLGGTVMEVDLLGSYGVALECGPVGYLDMDGAYYRVADLTIPVIIDALWTQAD
jgi:hypothetical protein